MGGGMPMMMMMPISGGMMGGKGGIGGGMPMMPMMPGTKLGKYAIITFIYRTLCLPLHEYNNLILIPNPGVYYCCMSAVYLI